MNRTCVPTGMLSCSVTFSMFLERSYPPMVPEYLWYHCIHKFLQTQQHHQYHNDSMVHTTTSITAPSFYTNFPPPQQASCNTPTYFSLHHAYWSLPMHNPHLQFTTIMTGIPWQLLSLYYTPNNGPSVKPGPPPGLYHLRFPTHNCYHHSPWTSPTQCILVTSVVHPSTTLTTKSA